MLNKFIEWCKPSNLKEPVKKKVKEKPIVKSTKEASKENLFIEIDLNKTCMVGFDDSIKLVVYKNATHERIVQTHSLVRFNHEDTDIVFQIGNKNILFPAQPFRSQICKEISSMELTSRKQRALNPNTLSLQESLASSNESIRKLYFPI